MPNVATLDEQGLKGFNVVTWYGISAPAGTPPAVIEKNRWGVRKVGRLRPTSKRSSRRKVSRRYYLGPKEFTAYLADDAKRMGDLIKNANIKGE